MKYLFTYHLSLDVFCISTKDILMNLKRGVGEGRWELSVRRQFILTDALTQIKHPSFTPTKWLRVSLSIYVFWPSCFTITNGGDESPCFIITNLVF